MAHNLARWTARIGLGQQIVTTKTLRRRVFCPGRTDHSLGAPPHPASSPALALGGAVQPRPGPAASHSTPSLTASMPLTQRPRQLAPTSSAGVPCCLFPGHPHIAAPPDGHWDPVRQLKTLRRPPIYPNRARTIAFVTSRPPSSVLTPSIRVHRWIRGKVWDWLSLVST